MNKSWKGLFAFFGLLALLSMSSVDGEDKCPCKGKKELTREDVLCMNSVAKFYSCLTKHNVEASEIASYDFSIFTGERTVTNRYDRDMWPPIIRKYIMDAKTFTIRGVQLKSKNGEPGVYLGEFAKLRFKYSPDREMDMIKARKENRNSDSTSTSFP